MNRKSERLVRRIEKAGIRASLRQGHVLTGPELRRVKIQVAPHPLRISLCLLGLLSGGGSYYCFTHDLAECGGGLAVLAVALFVFGVFGVRRSLSGILDSMDAVEATEVLGDAAEGIASAIGSLLDGV